MVWSWSSVSAGSIYVMLSMWGSRGTWSKKDGVGQLVILLVDLEGCTDFPGVEYIVGSDGTVVFERLDEEGKRGGGAP